MERKLLTENLNKRLEEMRTRAEEEYRKFSKELDRTRERAEWYVRYHPKKALLMSAGAGVILGLIISSLRRKIRKM